MSEQENVQVVQQLYAAFGRGDLPAVLNALADEVTWQAAAPAGMPWAALSRGREQVAQGFAVVNEALEFEQFEPREFIAQGDKVVVLMYQRGRVKATGRSFENDMVQLFTVRKGQVVAFRDYYDPASLTAAARGE